MKRIICTLALAVMALAPCLAEDSELEARVKSLEESVDQMKQDQAEAETPVLSQKLDWGKGWGLGANMGTMQNAPELGMDVYSPLLFKHFRVEATGMIWLGGNYPEPITHPDVCYTAAGFLGGLRVSYNSALLFNFMRVYGGLGADYYRMIGAQGPFSAFDSNPKHQMNAFITEFYTGVELYTAKNWSVYFEIVSDWSPFYAHTWVSEEDARFFHGMDVGPGTGGVTMKCGFRWYP
jgi:hypothetical protein